MQNTLTSDTRGNVIFDKKLEDIPGGVTLAVADLEEESVAAGTPVGLDSVTGLYHVVKTAEAQAIATDSATSYRVKKAHNFQVGDIIALGEGKKAHAITAIDKTTSTDYDTLTVGTTLGDSVAVGDIFIQSSTESSSTGSAFKYEPAGLTGTDIDITAGSNHLVDVIVRGSVREDNIVPIHADIKTALPLIRFV